MSKTLADTGTAGNEVNSDSESDDGKAIPTVTLQTPGFIYECQRTLEQIHGTLNKFGHSSNQSSQTTHKKHRFSLSALRHLEPKDLKWPLSQSKTRELIASLERHKATCTLALTGDSMIGVHALLKHTQLSNRYLAEIRADQETILQLHLSKEDREWWWWESLPKIQLTEMVEKKTEKTLEWLSPVNPALKHRALRQDRHDGTGFWLFDLPEMMAWLEKDNSAAALWIYGIPGSGKTTLSSLVIDEFLSHKRSRSVGVAYFYIRHDDKNSHDLPMLLGSLISQLARQKIEARASLMELYEKYLTQESPIALPTNDELVRKLFDVASHFAETYIIIDGLDECGSAVDLKRKRLINSVSRLHTNRELAIRTLVFSRDEQDIRSTFAQMSFCTVSVAAKSADLRLFVGAWLGELGIQSEGLKAKVLDTLVDEANGM
ncbi:MAG: hypothetical protein Q9169_003974 [Polycauliona sp. 2 TL-2023]